MFSRYRCRSAAAAALVCLAAVSMLAVFMNQPTYAKMNIRPACAPGDPDEFEARLPDGDYGAGRIVVSGNPSQGATELAPADAELAGDGRRSPASGDLCEAISLLVRRFVTFLTVELDVM